MEDLYLEIIEGPGAGTTTAVDHALVIGRADDADLALGDARVSRHHARVTPGSAGDGVTVEDLGSSNGTFVNERPLQAATRLDPGDELLIGVTVLQLRTGAQIVAEPSAVRTIPHALATQEHQADPHAQRAAGSLHPELQRLRDDRTRMQARTAPLAIFVVVVLVVAIYLAAR